ncbi:glycosyltransferase involved in cell wall biosynthesis [Sphingomonas kyeonggiensis]|uniref:glycosyltransferase family 2 protein n=1 Tax=Sphingomonas kyeonggiensis TaxID=1268553 RepID=UPI0027851865|nr:glycosyltransferase [Sphingomonas kyeonggiensis]MDQ0250387.1 glycosyltransferase involved in cell wall biosynthesis [Sphingomonas kyeonggiensis]
MSAAPTVSVIMPAYNGAAWIGATIDSVLAQDFTDWEMVIVDDCSTDDTRALLATLTDPRITVLHAEMNGGPVVARNIGFAAARGRYIAGLDQDDLCKPGRFAAQVAYLEANPGSVLVATAAELLENGHATPWPGDRPLTPATIDWLILTQNPLVWSTVMFRAEAARLLDPFERPQVRYAEDFDLYHRLSRFGRIARLDEAHLLYRCHPGGASKKFAETMAASAARVLSERYQPLFGDESQGNAELVVRYFMQRDPAPDLETLGRLSRILAALHADHVARTPLTAQERIEVDGEHARLWWLVARPALRQGAVTMREAMAVLPESVHLPANDPDRLISPLIGRVRAIGRGFGVAL